MNTPSNSGTGRTVIRCPDCRVAVRSHYPGAVPRFAFLRAGTLGEPDLLPPDIHIRVRSKRPWMVLPEGVAAMAEYDDRAADWPAGSLARREAALSAD